MYVKRSTEKGIARTAAGWAVVVVTTAVDEGVPDRDEYRVTLAAKLLDGPFTGVGAKARAIEAAGTNRLVDTRVTAPVAA